MEEFNSADILEKQNRKKRLAFLEVGMFEASFILIIIIVLFGVLNYFNILSLSAIYPNQLGFLPHQTISSNLNKPGANLQQTSVDYTKNAKNLDAPSYNSDLQQTVINAIFTGFNRNTLETEALGGKMTFVIDSDTIFQSLVPDSSSTATSGGLLDSGQTYTPDTFANQVPKGSLLQIFYIQEKNLKAVRVNYVPDYKFK